MLYVRTPKGFFPLGRHRPDLWRHPGLDRDLVPSDVRPAAEGGSDRARRSRRRRCRLLHRHLGLECLGQSRQPVHQPQAAGRARRFQLASRGQPAAAEDRRHPGAATCSSSRCRTCGSAAARAIPPTSSRCGIPTTTSCCSGRRACLAKIQTLPGLVDVSTDREQGGLQVNVSIDRVAASRLGVRVQDIANALNNAYAQRQISTLYTQRNQYRVILEIDPQYQRDPTDLRPRLCQRRRQHPGAAQRP